MIKSFFISLLLACVVFSAPSFAGGQHDFSFKVSRGDAFYKFFYSTGLSGKLLTKLMTSDSRAQRLNNIYPGDKFRLALMIIILSSKLYLTLQMIIRSS